MAREEYEVKALRIAGAVVILEAAWTGTLSVPLDTLRAGAQLAAHFAQVFDGAASNA